MKNLLKSFFLASSILLLVISLENCKHEPEDIIIDPVDTTGNTDTTTYDTTVNLSDTCHWDTVYFVNDVLPILIGNCAGPGCHAGDNPAEDIDLSSYDGLMNGKKDIVEPGDAEDSDIIEELEESDPDKRMPPPPASALSPEQIATIKKWIDQGALNNSCRNVCDTSNSTYSATIWPILDATCRGCHSGRNPNGGVSITNYNQVKALVDNGMLEGTIFRKPGYKGMPPAGAVDTCAQKKIANWIAAGAKNN